MPYVSHDAGSSMPYVSHDAGRDEGVNVLVHHRQLDGHGDMLGWHALKSPEHFQMSSVMF